MVRRLNMHSHSRGANAPNLMVRSALEDRAGEDRVHAAPAVPCAMVLGRIRTERTGSAGSTLAFPAQWVDGLLRALPGERLFCLRRPKEASVSPGAEHQRRDGLNRTNFAAVPRALALARAWCATASTSAVLDWARCSSPCSRLDGRNRIIYRSGASGIFFARRDGQSFA